MGWKERDYANRAALGNRRESLLEHRGTERASFTWLLLGLNILLYLLCSNPFAPFGFGTSAGPQPANGILGREVATWIALHGVEFHVLSASGEPWRLLSSMFLHADLGHLFFNMFVLFSFGPQLERLLGSRQYAALYLIAGIGAGALGMLVSQISYFERLWTAPGVGASGAIYAVLAALAVYQPHQRVMLLFPPVALKLRSYVLIILAIGVFFISTRGTNYGGELVHLGGALLGALFALKPQLLHWADRASHNTSHGPRTLNAQILSERRRSQRVSAAEVDHILDKVRKSGSGSLSQKDRELLQRYTENK